MSIPAIGSEVIRFNTETDSHSDPIVSQVQQALNQIVGESGIPETGVFNRETESAIREFQTSHNIDVTGTINQQTVDALNHAAQQQEHLQHTSSSPSRPPVSQETRRQQVLEQRLQGEAVRATLRDAQSSHFTDSLRALTTAPTTIRANGVDVPVHGATPEELGLIQQTLERLPASHIRSIPRIVVADTAAHGSIRNAGNSINQTRVEQLMDDPGYRRQLTRDGLGELFSREASSLTRLELTHANLRSALQQGLNVSPTLLHETAHWVDGEFGLSGRIHPDQLGGVVSGSIHNPTGDPRGVVMERFANAYSQYYRGILSDPVALPTMRRVLSPTEHPAQD